MCYSVKYFILSHYFIKCVDITDRVLYAIVPGGCLDKQRQQWKKLKGKTLFNEFNLATVFRAKFLATLRQSGLTIPESIRGLPAIKYLSRYLYRGVISEKNVISDDGVYVTFRYRESRSGQWSLSRVLALRDTYTSCIMGNP